MHSLPCLLAMAVNAEDDTSQCLLHVDVWTTSSAVQPLLLFGSCCLCAASVVVLQVHTGH